jgi:hypothetical protein
MFGFEACAVLKTKESRNFGITVFRTSVTMKSDIMDKHF